MHWLLNTLSEEQVDVLLVSGDVFDSSNPSAASIKMFYSFLNQSVKQNPHLQIIVTAGNHDSASRLESPKPLLESSNIHIVGIVEKDEEGNVDYAKICIPLNGKNGQTEAWSPDKRSLPWDTCMRNRPSFSILQMMRPVT